jgi:hypothetical protein
MSAANFYRHCLMSIKVIFLYSLLQLAFEETDDDPLMHMSTENCQFFHT